jgi:hypothetical protein
MHLGEHFIIKNEVIRIFEERQLHQHLSAEGAKSGVILRQFRSSEYILKRCEEPVGDILINGHAVLYSAAWGFR